MCIYFHDSESTAQFRRSGRFLRQSDTHPVICHMGQYYQDGNLVLLVSLFCRWKQYSCLLNLVLKKFIQIFKFSKDFQTFFQGSTSNYLSNIFFETLFGPKNKKWQQKQNWHWDCYNFLMYFFLFSCILTF